MAPRKKKPVEKKLAPSSPVPKKKRGRKKNVPDPPKDSPKKTKRAPKKSTATKTVKKVVATKVKKTAAKTTRKPYTKKTAKDPVIDEVEEQLQMVLGEAPVSAPPSPVLEESEFENTSSLIDVMEVDLYDAIIGYPRSNPNPTDEIADQLQNLEVATEENIYEEVYEAVENEVTIDDSGGDLENEIILPAENFEVENPEENICLVQSGEIINEEIVDQEEDSLEMKVGIFEESSTETNNVGVDSDSVKSLGESECVSEDAEIKKDDNEKIKITKLPKKVQKKKGKPDLPKDKEIDSEEIVRRSSRIKSINVLKKAPLVGHGLVKNKVEVENVESSNDSVKTNQTASPNSFQKPIKVKSRWTHKSELEMHTNSEISSTKTSETSETSVDELKVDSDKIIQDRLKQFMQLNENLYLTDRMSCKEAKKMICDCFLTEEEVNRGELGCGDDCLNRLLMIECGPFCQLGLKCTNKKFQKSQFAPVEVFDTRTKGLGLRAAANIPYGEFILEYIGEVLNSDEFEDRAEEYSKDKNQHYYFMSLRADAVIDATTKGNISRFINHSCDPNAETQKWTVNGELRIGFFSTRTILAGEEITFDYRFQRYGKEAQKCYCEAPNCRGWLGGEPNDEEDEDEEEEEEIVEEKTEETVELKTDDKDTNLDSEQGKESHSPAPKQVIKKKVRKSPKKKPGKDLFEELDQLDSEIDMLVTTGLKNQAHTLRLSRLILRAKEPPQRTKLLRVLRRGELPCRRLFLDYHGLRLIHGYMTDVQHLIATDKKFESLRLELLQTLAVLPIPNKTMLQDSKVLATVEKWSAPLTDLNLDSESNSPNTDPQSESQEVKAPLEEKKEVQLQVKIEKEEEIEDPNSVRESVGMSPKYLENLFSFVKKGAELAEEIFNMFEDDNFVMYEIKKESIDVKANVPNYEEEIIALALKLLEEWSNLKEVFRIPKKERIEQMKEHEREANKGYIAGLGLDQYNEKKSENRYRGLQKFKTDFSLKRPNKTEERNGSSPNLSKHKRRKLFALQVEQQEEERRNKQRELWRQHEKNCMMLGTDPRLTAPFDLTRGYQCIWNPQIGQWQNYPMPSQPSPSYPPLPLPNVNLPPPNIANRGNFYVPSSPSIQGIKMPPNLPLNSSPMSHIVQTSVPLLPPNIASLHSTLSLIQPNLTQINSHMPPIPPPMMQSPLPPPNLLHIPGSLPPASEPNLAALHSTIQSLTAHNDILTSSHSGLPISQALSTNPIQNNSLGYLEDKNASALPAKFLGPIPPPVKLPLKWKCAKDKYGRPYYYHIKIRVSQWEPPSLDQPADDSIEEISSSSSTTSSDSSSSSSSDSDSDDIDDSKLLKEVRKQMEKQSKTLKAKIPSTAQFSPDDTDSPIPEKDSKWTSKRVDYDRSFRENDDEEKESSIDRRLKEQFNLKDDKPPAKKRRLTSLVQEIIISPRTEEDKLQFKEDLKKYKENKEKLRRQKEFIILQTKKRMKDMQEKETAKTRLREMKYSNTEEAKKIKDTFRSAMATTVVNVLNFYRKPDCKEGKIINTGDFKHLARKLTHFVMLKEMKHIETIEELICTDNVKMKAREYIRKYMSKFGETYQKRDDEPEHYY